MSKKLIAGLTVAAVIGIGTYAFGHMGGGDGYYGRMHGGPMMHQGYYGESGNDYRADLKDEDIKALDEERIAFLKATDSVRQNLYSKELESELDQKRLDHMIKIRKLNPNAGRGFMMGGHHMGYGNASPEDSYWR